MENLAYLSIDILQERKMRKMWVKTMDLLIAVACVVALILGFSGGLFGSVITFIACALTCGLWAAISLMVEHLEQIRRNSDEQTKMLDAIDYNLTAIAQKAINPESEMISAR